MRRDGGAGVNKPWGAWSPIGRSIGEHVCWPFRGHDAMTAVARPYVAEGLDRGERVTYVGEGDPRRLRHDLDGLPGLNEHLERGRLQLVPAATLPASDPSVHPASELPVLAGMTSQALERIGVGASGGKVVIDAADLKFIDIRGLLTLDRHAIRTEAAPVLRSPP